MILKHDETLLYNIKPVLVIEISNRVLSYEGNNYIVKFLVYLLEEGIKCIS